MNILFFGSTNDSVLVLEKLWRLPAGIQVVAVVTQPAKPVGRRHIRTPTPVEIWAKQHNISVYHDFPKIHADLLVTASYGEKIPIAFIGSTTHGGLNVHPSLLPRWRGADPVPWAILSGDREIGVTIVTLSEKFDQGSIIAQKKITILDTDASGPLRTTLFTMGANILLKALPDFLSGKNKGKPQLTGDQPYAKRFVRDDGFEPWKKIMDPKESERMNRKYRAFYPWPGLWTTYKGKRIKILLFDTTPVTVQIEGKKPVSWQQFQTAYLAP